MHQLIKLIQQTHDDNDDASIYHLRFCAFEEPGVEPELIVELSLDELSEAGGPVVNLRAHESVLDVSHAPLVVSPGTSSFASLASTIAVASRELFADEQTRLVHLVTSAGHQIAGPRVSAEDTAMLNQRSARAFKYASTYHLTFSLFAGASQPSSWEIRPALEHHLAPLLESFSAMSTFTIDTQIQHFASLSPSIRAPTYDDQQGAWVIEQSELSGFVNAAEWPLNPAIGKGSTINFVLYAPAASQSPLTIRDGAKNSWLIPQWGGVQILNANGSDILREDQLKSAVLTYTDHLANLLGLPATPASLPMRLSSLTRERATSLILSASSTLGALSRLTLKLTSIAIPDNVAVSVDEAISRLQLSCEALREAKYADALRHARVAEEQAEKAFFDPSMVGQVYFPDEHKVAVYVPLLGPMAVPLVMALLKEIKGFRSSRAT